MYTYEMITDKDLEKISKTHLAHLYNDAVETIWHLNARIQELMEENEAVWKSYDEISNELYG